MSKLKIGLTVRSEAGIFSNGLDQNVYFAHQMLTDMGYEPILISESLEAKKLLDIPVEQADIYSIMKFDIILEIAHPLSDKLTRAYNATGKPLIGVKYGNSFMLDLEKFVDKGNTGTGSLGTNLPFRNREIWVSEQFYKFKDYIEMLTRAEVKIIPYIWDSSILRKFDDGFHLQDMKVARNDFRKIGIVEPNLNIVKNCVVPLSICEMAYNKRSDLIKEVYCFGAKDLGKNNVFINYVRYLNINNNKVASYEARYPIHKMFKSNLVNTIVSTQLMTEQNYVYLETLFYKRLLVHNSPMFKDIGYYYPDYNVNIGSDQLIDAIETFDQAKSADAYQSKLEEMSIYNEQNQEKTRQLIESVIK